MTRTTIVLGLAYSAFGLAYGRISLKSIQDDPQQRDVVFGSVERMMFLALILSMACLIWPVPAGYEFGHAYYLTHRELKRRVQQHVLGEILGTMSTEDLNRKLIEHWNEGTCVVAELQARGVPLPSPIDDLVEQMNTHHQDPA
jgi:hypothetical protein